MEDRDRVFCNLCLVTDVKMFQMNTPLLEAYSQLVQVVIYENYQAHLCYECVTLLRKFEEFRMKCMTAFSVLSSIHVDHCQITKEDVQNIDRQLFNLDSKLAHCSLFSWDSTGQNLSPRNNVETDVDLLKSDINSDLEIKPYIAEFEFKMDACDPNDDTKDEIISYDTDASNEIQEHEYDTDVSNEIQEHEYDTDASNEIQEYEYDTKYSIERQEHVHDTKVSNKNLDNYHDHDYVEQKKNLKCLLNKNSTEYATQSSVEINKEQNESESDDNISLVPRSRNTNSKDNGSRRKQVLAENCKNHFKGYATVVFLTPEDARNEMILRKESNNYKTNPHKCDLCFRGFRFQSAFESHMKKHSPDSGSWECKYCHQRFPTNDKFTKHLFIFHQRKYICEICPYACYDKSQANKHMNIHKNKNRNTTRRRNVSISDTPSSHKKVELPTRTEAVCAMCGSTFAAAQGLLVHYNLSHRQENIQLVGPKCAECDVQFATETAWKRHLVLSSKHTVDNGCEECGETFPSKAKLTIHSASHHRRQTVQQRDRRTFNFKPPAACKICDRWLTTHREYKDHMLSHHSRSNATKVAEKKQASDQNLFACDVCGLANFKSNFHLNHHRLTHTGERPYECRYCGKRFRYPVTVYHHENTHTRSRVFKCDMCQKEYFNKTALVKHIQAHLGIRPYSCSLCDKSFPQLCRLNLHIKYVHLKEPWPKRDRSKRRTKEQKPVL